MRKPGCIEPVIFFLNHRDPAHPPGFVMLAPYTSYPTPEGYTREGAETLAEVDKLQKKLEEQETQLALTELYRDEWLTGRKRQEVRDRLYARMISSATDEWEKEFIRCYLQLREEKRAKYQQRYLERTMYLWARENDSTRPVDQESHNVDRIG